MAARRDSMMMAARVHTYGGPDVIRYERVPRPTPGPGEVLVRVAAAGFNPSDVGFRAGLMRDIVPLDLPFTLGAEAAGTIIETGEGVEHLHTGGAVLGRLDRSGAAAEYLTAPAALMVRAPRDIPLAHAAALPVAGLTAWQTVFEHARPGQAHVSSSTALGAGSGCSPSSSPGTPART
ncbi:alcohol dehydrogenase catalytic domain-containing protein [Actinomadura madurae]|uniref:alcohol dehydrogenase catalytic domain-containing protein n=1 Tax=Actinomadura madurae TaxID=1993 RepID=UPI0020D2014C|nr:alcohol dehydrogenase catalytic domain-containing protein [Actinomadura madurae]MCP9970035.1 alcohol dehydrogenase catalytic domain-containing protein [Actinomadura madurae]MCP9982494.1 alcohol dehydrogenase catalytic domain-containing protein [Actinomadura madurae]